MAYYLTHVSLPYLQVPWSDQIVCFKTSSFTIHISKCLLAFWRPQVLSSFYKTLFCHFWHPDEPTSPSTTSLQWHLVPWVLEQSLELRYGESLLRLYSNWNDADDVNVAGQVLEDWLWQVIRIYLLTAQSPKYFAYSKNSRVIQVSRHRGPNFWSSRKAGTNRSRTWPLFA